MPFMLKNYGVTYSPRSTNKAASMAVHWCKDSSSIKKYVIKTRKLPDTAGTSLRAFTGTLSVYGVPIRSKVKFPSYPAILPARYNNCLPSGGWASKKKTPLVYNETYLP